LKLSDDWIIGFTEGEGCFYAYSRWKTTLENWGEHFTHPFRSWTENEVATAKTMINNGYTQKQIGKEINRTWRAVEAKKAEWKKSAGGVEA
jgi:hypothetical protein